MSLCWRSDVWGSTRERCNYDTFVVWCFCGRLSNAAHQKLGVSEYSPGGWQTSKKYRENVQLLFFYFLLNGRKIHAELLIEILVPTQIVCWSQEKSLSSSHKYFLLQIFGNFKQINSSIGLLENCLSNLLIFFRIHLRSWKEIFN